MYLVNAVVKCFSLLAIIFSFRAHSSNSKKRHE